MTTTILRDFFLWCSIINYGLLLVWSILFLLPHNAFYRLAGRLFRVSSEQFDVINLAGITLYKTLVIVFNIVPCVALWIIG